MPPDPQIRVWRHTRHTRAFTLIELLVVFTIIVILISAVLVGGPRLIDKARAMTTQSLLATVDSAIETFKREQTETPTITATRYYVDRYGAYPPDELEVFTPGGFPGGINSSLATYRTPGGPRASVFPPPTGVGGGYDEMRFFTVGNVDPRMEHRDLAAMILAIEMYSPAAKVILDGIPDLQRSPGVLDENGKPSQFLDVDGSEDWTSEDLQIRYIVDAWGVPISYLAQRDCDQANTCTRRSSNHPDWNKASTKMIRLNDGKPILMSYGPDGNEQYKQEAHADANDPASFVGDWADEDRPGLDNAFNQDNVYANSGLAEKLVRVVPQD